jgi:ferredoxin
MELYRQWKCFGLGESTAKAIAGIPDDKAMNRCNECGICKEKCPNDLPVRDRFSELATLAE